MGGTEGETLDMERTRALVPRTVAYIGRYGNALDKFRLAVLLGEPHTRDEIQAVLRPYRFDDGSWDYTPGELCEERVGSFYSRCHDKAMSWIDGLRPQPLTWFLDALQGAGFPSDEPLVVRGVARLLSLQQDDGTWQEPASQVETTVTAIRVLRWCRPELFSRPLPLA
ncbi:MAG: hypothetical protein AB1700_11015 [Bacillota bacterium]